MVYVIYPVSLGVGMHMDISGIKYTDNLVLNMREKYSHADVVLIHKALALVDVKSDNTHAINLMVLEVLVDQAVDIAVVLGFILAPLLWQHSITPPFVKKEFGRKVSRLLKHCIVHQEYLTKVGQDYSGNVQSMTSSIHCHGNKTILTLAFILFELKKSITTGVPCNTQMAKDVLFFVVPLANELNLQKLRAKLEDTAFNILNPEKYTALKERVSPLSAEDERTLEIMKTTLLNLLKRNSIAGKVQGRVKSLYSIYCKLSHSGKTLDTILDRIGLRVIVRTVPDCYRVLWLLHSHFQPLPGCFDDYIGFPKENSYQSLHTCVYPVRGIQYKPIEFQIRTECMHKESESGLAAHWQYKWKKQSHVADKRLYGVSGIRRSWEARCSHYEADTFFQRLFQKTHEATIVVFGREGRIVQLPEQTTLGQYLQQTGSPVSQYERVCVNGITENSGYILRDGDTVETNCSAPVKDVTEEINEPNSKVLG